MSASTALVGAVCIAPVIPTQANLCTLGTGCLTAGPPYQGCKSDGWPDDSNVEPMNHPGFEASHHTTGPPTGPH